MKSISPSEATNQESGVLNSPMAGPQDVLGQDHAGRLAAQLAGALAGPEDARQQAAKIVHREMIAGDADELQALAQEAADERDPGLQVIGRGQGLLVLPGRAAEAVDDLLDLDQRDLPLLGRHHEEAQLVLPHPLLDQGGQLGIGQGQRGDP
jgi:hypothetical protein